MSPCCRSRGISCTEPPFPLCSTEFQRPQGALQTEHVSRRLCAAGPLQGAAGMAASGRAEQSGGTWNPSTHLTGRVMGCASRAGRRWPLAKWDQVPTAPGPWALPGLPYCPRGAQPPSSHGVYQSGQEGTQALAVTHAHTNMAQAHPGPPGWCRWVTSALDLRPYTPAMVVITQGLTFTAWAWSPPQCAMSSKLRRPARRAGPRPQQQAGFSLPGCRPGAPRPVSSVTALGSLGVGASRASFLCRW